MLVRITMNVLNARSEARRSFYQYHARRFAPQVSFARTHVAEDSAEEGGGGGG